MFENIGEKLMGLAAFQCVVGIIGSIITGLIFLFEGMVVIGILIMVFGPLFSWISSWVTYAIGEIAENTKKNFHTREGSSKISTPSAVSFPKPSFMDKNLPRKQCPHCGEAITSRTCSMCGKENNLFK